jgi:hypothetical protein
MIWVFVALFWIAFVIYLGAFMGFNDRERHED